MTTLFSPHQVLTATRGLALLVGPQPGFTGVATDSRAVQPGDLFVAIPGERVDGHDFLEEARAKGAAGALVQSPVPGVRQRHTTESDWHLIDVTDTVYALGQLARYHRQRFTLPVIGITGSAGKTTTKEMVATILAQDRAVLKSHGNFNTDIGLPLTLFGLSSTHQAAVLEFGMRGRGQIGYLAALAQPTVGVITNIGLSHLELLGSQDEIARAKGELLEEMAATAIAILPRRDDYYARLREQARGAVLTIGEDPGCDCWVSDIMLGENGCARFTLHQGRDRLPIILGTPGRHQVWNALAAAAAALAVGATHGTVQAGLAAYQATTGRMQVLRAPGGYTVIDDTYNANPAAMRATLDFLAEIPGHRKFAVLGDMRELGPGERELHREIGAYALSLNLDGLLALGGLGQDYVPDADSRAQWFADQASAMTAARAILQAGDVVLVKGSRAMQMERIVAGLMAE